MGIAATCWNLHVGRKVKGEAAKAKSFLDEIEAGAESVEEKRAAIIDGVQTYVAALNAEIASLEKAVSPFQKATPEAAPGQSAPQPSKEPRRGQRQETPEVLNQAGAGEQSAPAEEPAYSKGKAVVFARRMTAQGLPSEAYPHPTKPGMWAIRPAGAAQPGEQAEPPAVEVPASRPARRKSSSTLLQAIINRGGIARSIMSDVGGDRGARYAPGVFTNNGHTDLSLLAEYLVNEDGFNQIDLNREDDQRGAQQLADLIARAIHGERILSSEAMAAEAGQGEERQYRMQVRQEAERLGIKYVGRPFSRVEEEVHAARERRNAEEVAALAEQERQAYDEVVAVLRALTDSQTVSDATEAIFEKLNREGIGDAQFYQLARTEIERLIDSLGLRSAEDLSAEIAAARELERQDNEIGPAEDLPQPDAESAEPRQETGRGNGRPGTEPEAARPAFDLEGQTEEQVRAELDAREAEAERQRAEEAKAAEAERKAREAKEIEDRAKRGVGADFFTLDAQVNNQAEQRKADAKRADAQLAGQGDVFSAPASPPAEEIPEAVRKRVSGALDSLREVARAIADAKSLEDRVGQAGRYQADTLENRKGNIESAQEVLRKFRELAAGKGIDAQAFIDGLGGEPDLKPSKEAQAWIDRPRVGVEEGAGQSPGETEQAAQVAQESNAATTKDSLTVESSETDKGAAMFSRSGQDSTNDGGREYLAQQEGAVYDVSEPDNISGDIFHGTEHALPEGGRENLPGERKAAKRLPRAARVLAVRESPDVPGLYYTRTQLVTVGERALPVDRVITEEDAAKAFAYLSKGAVERMDGLVTDRRGRPLAIIGSFKGATTQTSVYPQTVMMELARIDGAANLWMSHNHPSGLAELSRADENIGAMFSALLRDTSVTFRGLSAMVAREGGAVAWVSDSGGRGTVAAGEPANFRVPIVEREFVEDRRSNIKIGSPRDAERVVRDVARDVPGVLFLTAQHEVTAFVPVDPAHMGALRKEGRLMRLFRAAADANAVGAIVAMPDGKVDRGTFANIKGALSSADIKVLDGIEYSSSDPTTKATSLEERGLADTRGQAFLSRGRASTLFTLEPLGGALINHEAQIVIGGEIPTSSLANVRAARLYNADGEHEGNAAVIYRDGKIPMLVDIRMFAPQTGTGEKYVRAMVAAAGENGLFLYDIQQQAEGFWTKMGAIPENLGGELAHGNGFLFWSDYAGQRSTQVDAARPAQDQAPGRGDAQDGADFIGEGKARFERADKQGRIHAEDLNAVAAEFRAIFPGLPIHPVENEKALPDSLQQAIKDMGASGDVAAAFHKGAVWMVQSGIHSLEHARKILPHEGTHAGLEWLLGGAKDRLLLDILQRNTDVSKKAKEIASRYGYSQVRAAEEVLADMGPKVKTLKGWAALITWVRRQFRKLGWVQEWTNRDVEDLVLRALAQAKRGPKVSREVSRASAFARTPSLADDMAAPRFYDEEGEFNTVEELLSGLKDGRLLVHARVPDGTDFKYGIEPSAGEFLRSTEGWQQAEEEHGQGPDLTFFSDNLGWAKSSILGEIRKAQDKGLELVFVRKGDSIQKSLGDGRVQLADGSVVSYEMSPVADYENPLFKNEPAGVEKGDWYTNKAQDVVAVVPAPDALKTAERPVGAMLARSFSPIDTTSPEFKRWFGDSKVVDAEGKPLVVYHGTNADFSEFNTTGGSDKFANNKLGAFFAADPDMAQYGRAQMPVYLSIKNPYVAKLSEWAHWQNTASAAEVEAKRAQLIDGGHDGVTDGMGVYVAFRPEQIKSAVSNTGEFSTENPDIRFSRASQAIDLATDVLDTITRPSAKSFGMLKGLQTQLHKARSVPAYARVFRLAMAFRNDLSRAAFRPWENAKDILPAYDDLKGAWQALIHGKKQSADITGAGKFLFEGTMYGGGNPLAGVVYSDAKLKSMGATDEQVRLYHQARDAIDASLDEMSAAVAWKLAKRYLHPAAKYSAINDPATAKDTFLQLLEVSRKAAEDQVGYPTPEAAQAAEKEIAATMKAVEGVFDHAEALKAAGYAPLMRFGRYTVDVFETDGNGKVKGDRLEFRTYETEIEAKAAEKELRKAYANQPGVVIQRGVKGEETGMFAGVDPETVALFAKQVADIQGIDIDKAVLDEYYRQSVSERSALTRTIKRKGIAGYSEDLPRVLASFLTSNARYVSSTWHMGDMREEIQSIRDAKIHGDVADEAQKLYDYINGTQEPGAALRGLMFAWYLGGSPAAAAINLTQPVLMTFPYLSQFGMAKAAKALTSSAASAMNPKLIPAGLRAALRRAQEEGVVEAQEIHHLYQEGMRPIISRLPGGEDMRARAQGVAALWGSLFGMAENFNRRITFLAAYKMAAQDPALIQKFGSAYEFARRAVEVTQGIYAKENRPDWARGTGPLGAVGVAAFTFKQYAIQYVELLARMWRSGPEGKRSAGLMIGLLILASGLQGVPFADDLEDLIDTLLQSLGYRGNSKKVMRDTLRNAAGEHVADLVMYGLSAVTPIDVQARLGLGNIGPATALFKPSEQGKASQLAELVGPPGGMAKQVGDFVDAVQSGKQGDAFKAFSPKMVQDTMKAWQMWDTGEYRDSRGRKVTEVSGADAAIKLSGFQPQSVAEKTRRDRMIQQDVSRVRGLEADIASLWTEGIIDKEPEKVSRAREMLADWNSRNPDTPIRVTSQQILSRVKQSRMDREQRMTKAAPKEMRGYVADGTR